MKTKKTVKPQKVVEKKKGTHCYTCAGKGEECGCAECGIIKKK
jgi:hypothetical protein